MKIIFILFVLIKSIAFADIASDIKSDGVNTDAILISKNNKNIYEFYDRGYKKETPHLSWSMAKTITGILLAQASLDYGFSFKDKVSKFIPDFKGNARIIDLIQMSSGIDFSEEYFGLPVSSDVVKMLYLDGTEIGATSYVKSLPLREKYKPGDHFYYSSGDANLLMEVLKNVIRDEKKYENYPWEKIFKPLEIENAVFERDQNNIFIGSSYIYMTANNYLKIGQLIANNGQWNKQQIIPEFYIKLMHTVSPGVNQLPLEGSSSTRAYSAQATTNLPIQQRKLNSEYPDLPSDSILLLGHQGQIIVASSSQNLVIVRLGMDKGSAFNRDIFFKSVKDLIKKTEKNYFTAEIDKKFDEKNKPKDEKPLVSPKLKWMDLFKIPLLIKKYTAKEFCSCKFIVKRSDKECKKDIALTMPVMPTIEISNDKKITTHFFIGGSSQAEWISDQFGCRLVKSREK